MFEQLQGLFKDKREIFDLRTLDDPVALKTRWGPLVRSGYNFCSHRLLSSKGRKQMQVTPIAHLCCLFCIGVGVLFSGFMMKQINDPSTVSVVETENMPIWMFHIAPLSLSVFGIVLLWRLYRKNVLFDKKKGTFARSRRRLLLNEVHAIQLVSEYCMGGNSSYESYEMNLILKSGERFNVTDHSSLGAIQVDAKMLAEYLGIPVWDVIGYQIKADML